MEVSPNHKDSLVIPNTQLSATQGPAINQAQLQWLDTSATTVLRSRVECLVLAATNVHQEDAFNKKGPVSTNQLQDMFAHDSLDLIKNKINRNFNIIVLNIFHFLCANEASPRTFMYFSSTSLNSLKVMSPEPSTSNNVKA